MQARQWSQPLHQESDFLPAHVLLWNMNRGVHALTPSPHCQTDFEGPLRGKAMADFLAAVQQATIYAHVSEGLGG